MTKIKLCGLTRPEDIAAANILLPDYIGFVLAPASRRYVAPETAAALRARLNPAITAVGVFVREEAETVARLLNSGVIDIAQLHGGEDEMYLKRLRLLTDKPLMKAFAPKSAADIAEAEASTADLVLLDSGPGGTGEIFDWALPACLKRPYFLAGGLHSGNIRAALASLTPYAVDVSSGIETDGRKDKKKMTALIRAVRANQDVLREHLEKGSIL